ncbi:hypothetical protein [Streptomyces sp. NBC_01431]|uniref:hypothetical protein n=1 Tax=Streptomyces sp. NBC_01431 TaxID=2903863 RepID=UPI002E334409|nr:hypothetical protein [Streptomyces sp. NBC_01431]
MARITAQPLLVAAMSLTLLVGGFAVWASWSWYSAAHDDTVAYAASRDEVLAVGEQAVQNLSTLDHKDVAHGLDLWQASTTGDLHQQLSDGRGEFEKQVRQAQTVTTAKVLDGAVTELDDRAGKARVMVSLRITVQAPKQQPAAKDSRMLGELTRTPAGWKLSALGQAPVGSNAPN